MVDANQSSPTNSGKKVTYGNMLNCEYTRSQLSKYVTLLNYFVTFIEGCWHFESGGGLQAAAERPQCGRLRVPQGLGRLWADR